MYILCLSAICLLLGACNSNEVKGVENQDKKLTDKIENEKLTQKAEQQELTSSQHGIIFALEKEQFLTSDKELIVNIQNDSNLEFLYGRHFLIQKKIDGIWYSIPFKNNVFEDIGLILRPNESSQITISLERLESELSPGEHRLLKSFEINSELSKEKKFTLAAPFKVITP